MRRMWIVAIMALLVLTSAAVALAQQRTHVVQPGETLYRIALRYGLTVEQLAAANGITNPSLIRVGQVLIIPGNTEISRVDTTSYTVVAGDTLYSIARRFGTTVDRLIALNGLTNPGALRAGQTLIIPSQGQPTSPATNPTSDGPATLSDYWEGRAEWVLEVGDTGLPVGESDTIYMGGDVYWSYLHASFQSAGIRDSCGEPVAFPGCVTRWISTNGGGHFQLAVPRCLLPCNSCPCDDDDHPWQQQYPRVVRAPGGTFYMVYEQGASTWFTSSADGVTWARPRLVRGTGIWQLSNAPCPDFMRIGPHPSFTHDWDCLAGGPPGLFVEGTAVYIFVGLGQNPAHMGCFRGSTGSRYYSPCRNNPLFSGASEYGPLDASGASANPYFDFRYITSADIVRVDGYYYMAYEGIRGPSSPVVGRDNQFALGFARSQRLDSEWEEYPGNPVLGDVAGNWGIGHADIVIADGTTYLYTATPWMTRGRYVLVFKGLPQQ